MVAPLHHYTGQVAPDLGIQVHLRSGNDATTSWLRLTSTSNHFIHVGVYIVMVGTGAIEIAPDGWYRCD